MTKDIKAKSISAVAWSGLEVSLRQGIQFFVSITLARLLAPEEFGVMAMLFLFTALAGCFVEAGFSAALIQKQDVTEEETSAVFYFNLAAGLMAGLLLGAAAPWIAGFYGLPILKPLTWLMALNLFLGSFGAVHRTLLTKRLDFGTQARISAVATLVSGGAAVWLAWKGYGVWSLAFQALLSTAISTVLLWCWHAWRPMLRFRLLALRSLFRFGSYLFFSALLNTAHSRLYTVLLGKLYSPADLGQYTRADTTQQLPGSLLATVVDRVAFPVFSRVAHDDQLLRAGLRRAIAYVMLLNLPASLGLLAVARPLVLSLFGSAWLPCVPYLQVLCLAGAFWPLHVLNLSCLMAKGRSDLFFRLEVYKKALGIGLMLLAAQISILAIAWSQVLTTALCFFLNAYYTGVLVGYPALSQLRDLLPAVIAASVMVGCVLLVGLLEFRPPAVQLALQVLAGAVVYAVICQSAGITAFRQLRQQVLGQLLHRNVRLQGL